MSGIVDTHTHAISPDQVRYPLAPVGGHQSDWSAHRPTDYEALLAALDAAGIAHAMRDAPKAATTRGKNASGVDAPRAASRTVRLVNLR